jgi:hypothetical protein
VQVIINVSAPATLLTNKDTASTPTNTIRLGTRSAFIFILEANFPDVSGADYLGWRAPYLFLA